MSCCVSRREPMARVSSICGRPKALQPSACSGGWVRLVLMNLQKTDSSSSRAKMTQHHILGLEKGWIYADARGHCPVKRGARMLLARRGSIQVMCDLSAARRSSRYSKEDSKVPGRS